MLVRSRPPVPASALIGRGDDVAAVRALLDAPGTRLVTLTGPPGVGKTRLALESVAGRDDVAWTDLGPVRTPRAALSELARSLGVASLDGEDGEDGEVTVLDRDVLVLVDNCEHLPEAMPALGRLLAATPRLRVLATSRERLRLSAEHEYPVAPLPMPTDADAEDWDRLRRNPAVAMLLARAPGRVGRTRDTARALADVCIRVDGLPLAIELAAARLRVFTPAELAFRLEHRIPVLTGGARDVPDRHRDLRAAIAWSHDLLAERDRRVFRALSVFPGEWTVPAAEAVCGDGTEVLDAVESLLDKSLIRRVDVADDTGRFTMLPSLREFATDQLRAHGEDTATRDRHAEHFARQARERERTVGTDTEIATLSTYGQVRADLRVAYEHTSGNGDVDAMLWLATGLGWYAFTHGTLTSAERLRDTVRAGVRHEHASPDARTAALLVSGIVAHAVGDQDAAQRDLQEASDYADASGDDRRYAIAHAFLGHVATRRGDFDAATGYYVRTWELYAKLGNRRGVAWAAHDLGLLALERGDTSTAEHELRDALHRFEELDYEWAVAVTCGALAASLVHRGERDESGRLLVRGLHVHEDIGDRRGLAQSVETAGALALVRNAAAAAARLLGAAATLRTATAAEPSGYEAARTAEHLARLDSMLGAAQAAHERRAGRVLPWESVRDLASRIASPGSDDRAPEVALTGRQHEVATLIATGSTNRQIGRSLGISEKTTEIHVRNIMVRLGVGSRAEVAAWVAAHQLHASP